MQYYNNNVENWEQFYVETRKEKSSFICQDYIL